MEDDVEEFLEELENFNRATFKLTWAWEKVKGPKRELTEGGLYPFQESFDEMAIRISDWCQDLKEKFEEYDKRSETKLHYFVVVGYKNRADEINFYLDHDMQELVLPNSVYNPKTEKMEAIIGELDDTVATNDVKIMSKLCEKLEVYRNGE
jgi:hypothetical protein